MARTSASQAEGGGFNSPWGYKVNIERCQSLAYWATLLRWRHLRVSLGSNPSLSAKDREGSMNTIVMGVWFSYGRIV